MAFMVYLFIFTLSLFESQTVIIVFYDLNVLTRTVNIDAINFKKSDALIFINTN